MQTNDELLGNTDDVLISLVNKLQVEIEERGLPHDVVDAANDLEAKVLAFLRDKSDVSLVEVNSTFDYLVKVLRELMVQPEWKGFVKSVIIRTLVEILKEIYNLFF